MRILVIAGSAALASAVFALAGSDALARATSAVGDLRRLVERSPAPLEVVAAPLPEYVASSESYAARAMYGSGHAPLPRAMEYG